jgi:Flp pilus assembly protein TadG
MSKQPSLKRRRRRSSLRRRGAATIEFACAAPLLFVLLLGMIDVGQLANVGQTVSGASSLGAREAAKPTTDLTSDVKTKVTAYFANRYPSLSDAELAAALDVDVLDSAGRVLTGTALEAIDSGEAISVQVAFTFDTVRWLGGAGVGRGSVLRTNTVVRRE